MPRGGFFAHLASSHALISAAPEYPGYQKSKPRTQRQMGDRPGRLHLHRQRATSTYLRQPTSRRGGLSLSTKISFPVLSGNSETSQRDSRMQNALSGEPRGSISCQTISLALSSHVSARQAPLRTRSRTSTLQPGTLDVFTRPRPLADSKTRK